MTSAARTSSVHVRGREVARRDELLPPESGTGRGTLPYHRALDSNEEYHELNIAEGSSETDRPTMRESRSNRETGGPMPANSFADR